MKLRASGIAWLLPLILTACLHKGHQQPVQPTAPSIDNAPVQPLPEIKKPPVEVPPPSPTVAPAGQKSTPESKPPVKHSRPVKRNAGQAVSRTPATPVDSRPIASANPGVSAIGQLTSDDSFAMRQQTLDAIAAIEQGLNRIDRNFSEQEQKTAAQIREYLKQASSALSSGDVDGAHTLAAKARLLFGELTR